MAGSLNLDTAVFGATSFFVVGGCLVHCRMCISILGLYPLEASSTPSLPVVTIKDNSNSQISPRRQNHPELRAIVLWYDSPGEIISHLLSPNSLLLERNLKHLLREEIGSKMFKHNL